MHTAEINLNKIYHIGFIGKSVTEVHLDESYLETFTRKIELVECHILKDFDPLSPANFKLTEFIGLPFEKQLQKAANLYKKRIESQQKNSPESMYRLRKYLGSKLSNLQSQSHDSSMNMNSNTMDKRMTQLLMNNRNEIRMNETTTATATATTTIPTINCLVDTCIPLLSNLNDPSKSLDNDNDEMNQEIGQNDHIIEIIDDDLPLSTHPQKKYTSNQQEIENMEMCLNTESEERNELTGPETADLVATSILIEICKCENYNIYLPPSMNEQEWSSKLNTISLVSKTYKNMFVFGDFNSRHKYYFDKLTTKRGQAFKDTMDQYNLRYCFPAEGRWTYLYKNKMAIPDLLFCSPFLYENIDKVRVLEHEDIGRSDHKMILCSVSLPSTTAYGHQKRAHLSETPKFNIGKLQVEHIAQTAKNTFMGKPNTTVSLLVEPTQNKTRQEAPNECEQVYTSLEKNLLDTLTV